MKASDAPIIVETKTKASVTSIWRSLTLLSEIRQWLFEEVLSFVAKEDFHTEFDLTTEDTTFRHVWVVKEVKEKEKLVVEWSYTGHEGKCDVCYEIKRSEEGYNIIRLTNTVTEDFDDNIPQFRRESAQNGWNYLIKERLTAHLG